MADPMIEAFFHPKPLADFLDMPHQKFSAQCKDWSVYSLKAMRIRLMVQQAVEPLKPVRDNRPATQSRAGITFSVEKSVMDRFGTLLRCPWSWESGRCHEVVRGQD